MLLPYYPTGTLFERIPPQAFTVGCASVGLVFLVMGWRMHRIALAMIGGVFGIILGIKIIGPELGRLVAFNSLYLAIPLGLVLAALAVLVMRTGAFCAGGACAAVPAFMLLSAGQSGYWPLAIAAAAFVAGGLLTLLLWRPAIILCISFIAALCLTNGLLLVMDGTSPRMTQRLLDEFSPLVWFAAAIFTFGGVVFQGKFEDEPEEA